MKNVSVRSQVDRVDDFARGLVVPFEGSAGSKKPDRMAQAPSPGEPTSLISSQRSHPDSEKTTVMKARIAPLNQDVEKAD